MRQKKKLWNKKERDVTSNNNNTDTGSNSNKYGNGLERGFRKELDKGRRGETGEKGRK
jgi:hypothetical protein